MEFKDAIREGHSKRILRCWKVFVMYFQKAGHTNYLQESLELLAATAATASQRIASQLTWGRVVNTRGKAGCNIPVDLCMEHLNRHVKDYVATLGPNVAESAILQCGQSLNGILEVCSQFDKEHGIHPDSMQHSKPQLPLKMRRRY